MRRGRILIFLAVILIIALVLAVVVLPKVLPMLQPIHPNCNRLPGLLCITKHFTRHPGHGRSLGNVYFAGNIIC